MKNALLAILMALFTAGCGAQTQVVFESNPSFSDANMNIALESESAFCRAASLGEKNAYAHVASLPSRGYRSNFSIAAGELGYIDRLGEAKKNRTEYIRALRSFYPAVSGLDPAEGFNACMHYLGWKTADETTGRDRLQIDKNNRAETLVAKIKKDPLAGKSIQMMSINMDRLSYRQAQEEKKRLFADPSIFEQVYMRNRVYVHKNGKKAESMILASSIGVDFARCSAMYSVINQKREDKLKHDIVDDDRLLSMEKESFYYASHLMHAEAAQREKRSYARKFQTESGPNLSGIMLRFKEESSQCATMLQGFKKIRFSAR